MVNVWDARVAIYDGFRALEWYRYLRAMWVVCGELQELYLSRPSGYGRSLEAETLDLVRQVAIMENVTSEASSGSGQLYRRWDKLFSAQYDSLECGEGHLWRVFVDLTGEIADSRLRYRACEWINTAATQVWIESSSHPAGEPIGIDNPYDEADENSPMMLTLARVKYIVDRVAVAEEVDPAGLKRKIVF
jgi:hypothetical protein